MNDHLIEIVGGMRTRRYVGYIIKFIFLPNDESLHMENDSEQSLIKCVLINLN